MQKLDIIKAMECCSNPDTTSCRSCPYNGHTGCHTQLKRDAAALLKADNQPAKPKYTLVQVYTKKGNLLPWYHSQYGEQCLSSKEYYAKERDIQLIVMFRFEGNRCFCKIKCPVNPLPVKGEFEVPSTEAIRHFLNANGWNFKQKFYPRMFE